MKNKVHASKGAPFSDKDAAQIQRFLLKHFPDGIFNAKQVLQLARPRTSDIHRFFNWNDTEAAEKYRLIQARTIIRCLVIDVSGNDVRKYISPVAIEGLSRKAYVEIEKARASKEIWEQVLVNAMQDAIRWRERYSRLKKISTISKAITMAEEKLKQEGLNL